MSELHAFIFTGRGERRIWRDDGDEGYAVIGADHFLCEDLANALETAQDTIATLTRERHQLKAPIQAAIEAMGNGADEERWPSGTHVIAALIAERDQLKARAEKAEGAFMSLLASVEADEKAARDAGLDFGNIRDAVNDLAAGEITFSRLVELMRRAVTALSKRDSP